MPATAPRTVAIVPHTHWDREWYEPFQTYRVRLVRMLDDFLTLLEGDPSYAHFLLDGQTAVVDDYLEVRPEAAPRLRALAEAGRLAAGPWTVLMDEFMVSGETIVRNLQLGLARAKELGRALRVGYLPDMFGHIAQMPQILRLAGIDHAVVWRGVPTAVEQTAFWWDAPDGSRVRAEYLFGSYSNGRDIPKDAAGLVARARDYELELDGAALDGGGLLLMNGTDHQIPQPWLGRVVEEANAVQQNYRFVITSLDGYLETQPVEGLEVWAGELRSGARSNLLMGVTSNRVDVKQAAARAERAVERRAEPLAALLLPPDRYPGRHLGLAWRELVLNSAHDSSCACSADEVVDEVIVRYRRAEQIGAGIAQDVLDRLAFQIDAPPGSCVAVNASPAARTELVEVEIPGSGPLHLRSSAGQLVPAQVVDHPASEAFTAMVEGGKVAWVLDMMRGHEFAGRPIKECAIDDHGERVEIVAAAASPSERAVDLGSVRSRISELAEDRRRVFRFRLLASPTRTVWFSAPEVPAYGWQTFTPVEGDLPGGTTEPDRACRVVDDGSGVPTLDNGLLQIAIDPATGTFAVTAGDLHLTGLQRLVDGGDGGDTYNYSPPAVDRVVDRPEAVVVTALDAGPLRARLRVEADYTVPRCAEGNERSCNARSQATAPLRVVSTLEVRAGEPFLRVRVTVHNEARDHRLRAHFPLPARVSGSHAGCAFAVTTRSLTAEGGPHEEGIPTFPARGFVDCSDGRVGLAILHDGVIEYEVVEDGTELALTLLRATGFLSRREPSLRPNPAGPQVPVEGPQMLGHTTIEYVLLPHHRGWHEAGVPSLAHQVFTPLEAMLVQPVTTRERPASASLLQVEGAHVSALVRDDRSRLIARIVNLSPEPRRVKIRRRASPARGHRTDLLGKPDQAFHGDIDLLAFEIATLLVDEG